MNIIELLKMRRRMKEVPSRYFQILYTLTKYGLAQFVTYIPVLKRILRRFGKNKRVPELVDLSLGEKLCRVAVELGPTFIKFGQLLSSRKDLIPEHILEELESLQDEVPAFSFEEARTIVEESLGKPVTDLFAQISSEPEAAASLAQVHKAVLPTGEKVAVKIKRPGIDDQIGTDLTIMRQLAKFVDRNTHLLKPLSAVEMVDEFKKQITGELDFRNELLNIEKFRKACKDDQSVIIPKPYEDFTTTDVLVLDFVNGKNINAVIESDDSRYDKKLIIQRAADFLITHMLIHGLFHADPHPGNLFVMDDNRICLIDFGIVYSFQPFELEQLNYLMLGLGRLDPVLVGRSILKLGGADRKIDKEAFQQAVYDFIEAHLDKPLEYIEASRAFIELLRLVIRFNIRLPPRMVYVAKVVSILESIAQDLDPDFNVIEYIRQLSTRIWLSQFASQRVRNKLLVSALDWTDTLLGFPELLGEAGRFLRDRELKIGMPDLISAQETIDKIGFRMVFGLVLAAILISSSLAMHADIGPAIAGIPIFGFVGFGIGTMMGVIFLFSAMVKMLKWRKRK